MKIDLEKLKAATTAYKASNGKSILPKHEAWVPFPEKDFAKTNGVKWNNDLKRHEFAAADPDAHICGRFQPKNFVALLDQVPYDFKEVFKELGVVTTQTDGKWTNYVMQHEDYAELIQALMEIELL